MFEISQEQAQWLSYIGGGVFIITLILLPFGILTERSRWAIRTIVFSGLTCALVMGCISGYLYIWHHYYR